MTRNECYAAIKNNNWQAEVQAKFGKNFTQCKTADLEAFIASKTGSDYDVDKEVVEHIEEPKNEEGPKNEEVKEVILEDVKSTEYTRLSSALIQLVSTLQANRYFTSDEAQAILGNLK